MQTTLFSRPVITVSFKGSSYLNLQNLMLVFSSMCIAAVFYFSNTRLAVSEETITAASSSENQKPFYPNGSGFGQSTQSVTTVVADALAFYNSLTSSTDKATLQLTYTTSLARKWSNLPCGTSCRNGLQLGTNLTSAQYLLAMQIIKDALGTTANDGSDEYHQMNLAEAYLHANGGGSGYDSTLRWMAFLNTPSATGAWMLQFGGHHYAANIAFNNGHVIGATPFFMGLEPKTFTYNSVTYDPLGGERDSIRAALASLSSSQLSTAVISSSFSDCVMIPGETNGGPSAFPSAAIGQPLSSLTTTQKSYVLSVIKQYVRDMDSATYNAVIAGYNNELSQSYISYHGSGTAGTASSFLVAQGDYARISGPNVWIEFSCQGGVVIQGQIHYHTVWRDRSHDYGVDLTGAPIDVLGTTPLKLISFGASVQNKMPVLYWVSANESNVSHFEIEQSTNPSNSFQNIGSVTAKNLGIETQYNFNSSSLLSAPITYFRLKMVDKDGKITYSSIVTLRLTATGQLTVNSQVPGTLILSYPSSYANGGYKIINLQGQILLKGKLPDGATSSSININALPTAQYIVIVENGTDTVSSKFFKN